jgi:thioredoxin reductase
MDTDVVVVGGGGAGLQAALTLGRMRFDVAVVDAGRPSNAPAHAIGGLLAAHDVAPLDLLRTGRAQLAELPSVHLIDGEATRVDGQPTVTLTDGSAIAARAVVLATGMHYAFPDVPGMAELWGTSVIHCPFCHGWEARDARIGLLSAGDEHAGHLVPLLRRLTNDLRTSAPRVYAAGDLVAAAPAVVQALATGQRAAVGITRDLAAA